MEVKSKLQSAFGYTMMLYVGSCVVFAVYFNWQYFQYHGFWKWLFFGEIMATAKALVWPLFIFIFK